MCDDGSYAIKWYNFPHIKYQYRHFWKKVYNTEMEAVEGMLFESHLKMMEKERELIKMEKQKQFKNKTFSKEEIENLLTTKDII